MSGMKTRKREREERDSWKYKRVTTALAACGFTELHKYKFLRHEMIDARFQKCIENFEEMDLLRNFIIPNIDHQKAFITEFEKTKVGEDEKDKGSSSSSQPAKNTPGRIQQPDAFINPFLRKIKMEVDYVPVKAEPEETEDNDGAEEGNPRNQMISLKGVEIDQSKINVDYSRPVPPSENLNASSKPQSESETSQLDDNSVDFPWNVTFEKIQKLEDGKDAVKIMEIISFLYADKIPSSFLHDLVPEINDAKFFGALKLLEKYSMIKMNERDFCLSIHRQLQFVILQYLKECDDVSNVVRNIVDKCEMVLKNIKLSECSDIFLNVHQIVSNHFDLITVAEKFLDFMAKFGRVLSRAGRYSESLELHKKVYSKSRELLGENHEETLTAQDNIAMQLGELGRYDESLKLYKEILEKKEIHLGMDHPDTITTKYNIANVLLEQGKYQEFLELSQQVLAQYTKVYGEDHPLTLKIQHRIAVVHSNLGNFSQALVLYEELQKKETGILGPDHEDVLQTKHTKADVFFRIGKFQEASTIFKENYEKEIEILGENHLDTITTLFWIARTLEQEGKFTEALEMYKKVYKIREAAYGEDHPATIITKHSIAAVLLNQGKYQESLEILQQVLDQQNKIHGENDLRTLDTQNSIAVVHAELGNSSKALTLYEDVEKKQTEVLGRNHRDVLTTKHNKATVLFDMGKFEEASKILNEVHEKYKEILGENHLETVSTLVWIGGTLEQEGKLKEALKMYKKVYEIRKANLGENHPQTIDVESKIENAEMKLREANVSL